MNTRRVDAISLLLITSLLNSQATTNNTLYVNPSGDDANDGSFASPFRTLATAFAHLTNNTCLVISGNFTNAVDELLLLNCTNVTLAGVEGATITFPGYGNGIRLQQFENMQITGLTLVGDRSWLWDIEPSELGVVGALALSGTNNSGFTLRDCRLLDWPDHGVTAWVAAGGLHGHTTDNVWVQNNVFQNIGTTNYPAGSWTPGDGACLSTFFRNNVWVQNNYASNCLKFFEFEPAGDERTANLVAGNWHIEDNVLVDHMGWLVFTHDYFGVSSRDVWIERNYLKQSVMMEATISLRASTNVFIRSNTFVSVSAVIQPQVGSDNIVVENNTFDGGYHSVVFSEPLFYTKVPCWNLTIRSNIFQRVHNPLILGAVNTHVENNTFAGLPECEPNFVSVLNGGHAYGPDQRGWATNLTFINNSFFPPFNPDSQFWLFTAGSNRLEQFIFSGNRDYCSTPVSAVFLDPPWTYARSNMFIDQPAGSRGNPNGRVKAATGSRWVVEGLTYVNMGDDAWESDPAQAIRPVILAQPIGQSQVPGLSATFTVRVSGAPPLSYQWQLNGADIAGATEPSLTLTNVQASDFGSYRVLITNSEGSVLSAEAVLQSGQVAAWGTSGDLPGGEAVVPVGATNLLAVAAGKDFKLALKADGSLLGWGTPYQAGGVTIPEELSGVVAISGRGDSVLALRSDGTVVAWGDDTLGQTDVPYGLGDVVAIAAGTYHGLALKADGTVAGWGGESGEADVPLDLTNVVAVAAGSRFSLALTAAGMVVAWGDAAPQLPPLTDVVAIAAGADHALALLGNGTVVAWGSNDLGQASVPADLANVVAIAAGATHSLALLADGTVVGWGKHNKAPADPPAGLANVVAISAGDQQCLAIVGDGPPVPGAMASSPALSEAGFQFSVPSQSGRVYALEYKNSLEDASWTALPLVAGNGGELRLTDPAPDGIQRFYRVRRW